MTKYDARNIALNIANVGDLYHTHNLSHDEFRSRMRALWAQVDQGELNIIGSRCAERMTMVHLALESLRT